MGSNPNYSKCIRMAPSFVLLVLFFTTITCTSAYNITYFLDNHPDFSVFNQLLTKTGVDKIINNLNSTITVLAVDNSAISPLSSQSKYSQKNMLATHVLFDYFDIEKLKEMKEKTPRGVINLYQKTGKISGKQGTTNIVKVRGDFIFYSPVYGAPKNSKLVDEVGSKPFDIIVLQISTPLIVPRLNSTPIAAPPPTPPSPESAPTPAPAPAPSPDDDEVADAPEAKGPAPTHASTPSPSPNQSPEDAPADDDKSQAKTTSKNDGGRNMVNGSGLVGVLIGFLTLAL